MWANHADWASSIDDTENTFVPSRRRPKPPSSIEHRAEPIQPPRTNISYPVILPTPSLTGIKLQVDKLIKGTGKSSNDCLQQTLQ
jgi:hypothetical protein